MFGAIGLGNDYMYGCGMQNAYFTNQYTSNCNTAIAARIGKQLGTELAIKDSIQSILTQIASKILQLSQLQQNSELTEKEKAKIKAEIEKLQTLEKQIKTGLVNLPSVEQVRQIEKGVGIALGNTESMIQEIIAAHAPKENANTDSSTPTDSTDGGSDEGDTKVSEEAEKKAKEKLDKDKTEALEIISAIYNATEGYSQWYNLDNDIDYPKLREAAKKINKDNVANIITYWDEQLTSSKGKSLVKALFDGEHGWNPSLHGKNQNAKNSLENANNMDVLWNITVCLKEKAKELGIYNDLAGQFTVAFDELDDTCVDEDAIENAISEIASAISAKQTEKLAESAQEEVDLTTKTDTKREAAKRKPEVEAQKKQEFQNALRKAYGLGGKLPELISGFRVITDNDGEFKEYEVTINGYTPFKGESFESIITQLKDYDIDPKKALIKRVDTKA